VVKNLTKELMEQREFPYSSKYSSFGINKASQAGIQDGIALGTMLGRKLQIRSEVKVTKFSRLDGGKIDRRLISGLGYDIENIFYQTNVDKYKNVHLHISVDASSSMESKWKKTMTTLVALAKAASMINNVDVVISFRSGVNISTRRDESPYIAIAYDSRKDKFSKITSLFPMLYPNGTTPEGLAFQAVMDLIPPPTQETDTYFVNMSDGEPAFSNTYLGENAALHTSKQVKKIRDNGIQVISYYIEDAVYKNPANQKCFRIMYGKDANFIDVSNITQIAHSLNKKFLAKASELV
jgi:nitric oxide reductase activation protein